MAGLCSSGNTKLGLLKTSNFSRQQKVYSRDLRNWWRESSLGCCNDFTSQFKRWRQSFVLSILYSQTKRGLSIVKGRTPFFVGSKTLSQKTTLGNAVFETFSSSFELFLNFAVILFSSNGATRSNSPISSIIWFASRTVKVVILPERRRRPPHRFTSPALKVFSHSRNDTHHLTKVFLALKLHMN